LRFLLALVAIAFRGIITRQLSIGPLEVCHAEW